MEFGYILENFSNNNTPDFLIQSAQLAEELGFHSIWATDHIMQPFENRLTIYNSISEAITTLSFLAGYTATITLGISTLVLPLRNTILLAKQLATLDYLTKGRLLPSFGAGWNKDEFTFLNQNFKNRGKRMNEQLQVIRSLWKGQSDFSGDFHSFQNASFAPRSDSLSKLPILVAGNSQYAFSRALKFGDGWHPSNYPPKELSKLLVANSDSIDKSTFKIWVRLRSVGTLNQDEVSSLVAEYEKCGVTGLLFDRSRNETKDQLKDLEVLGDNLNLNK